VSRLLFDDYCLFLFGETISIEYHNDDANETIQVPEEEAAQG
jgi:hypothetical protein